MQAVPEIGPYLGIKEGVQIEGRKEFSTFVVVKKEAESD